LEHELAPEDFLPAPVMRAETLRPSARFEVRYNNGTKGDFFYLRGEAAPEDLEAVREHLRPYEPCKLMWTTLGRYPGNSTLGEGYTWPHVDAYARFAMTSMEHAWKHGLRDKVAESMKMSLVDFNEHCAEMRRRTAKRPCTSESTQAAVKVEPSDAATASGAAPHVQTTILNQGTGAIELEAVIDI